MADAPILSWEKLGLVQGEGWLFNELDIHIGARDRLALIGKNGAGKTTLLRLLNNEIEPDEGKRIIRPGIKIVMLDQDPDFTAYDTLLDFSIHGDKAPPTHAVNAIADQLGIDLSRAAKTASGGERRRAALCRALASDADLLLLDEPTNHLDLDAIEWLENYLQRFSGAFLVISHDRTFLERLTRQTIWLDRGTLRRREVGFGGYERWMEEVYSDQARQANRLDSKLKQEAIWLERGVTARRKRNQGRLEKLYEMREQRAAMLGPVGRAALKVSKDDNKSKAVIVAENISKSYESNGERHTIIQDFTFRIQRGDRIGIVGANGAGKTTLLRLLTKEITPDNGHVIHARKLSSIFIDQKRSLLSPEKTVRDILTQGSDWINVRGQAKHIQAYLKEFLFSPQLVDAKIGTFSGGEQSRLLLAREFARPSSLLILDEPTNDLDLDTLDLLQNVISEYDGTVLLVSHDRDFLDKTAVVTLGLDGSGTIDIVAGGYADWEAKRRGKPVMKKRKKKTAKKQHSKTGQQDGASTSPRPGTQTSTPRKLSYKDQRLYDNLPKEITEKEKNIGQAEVQLNDPDLYSRDPKTFQQLSKQIAIWREEIEIAEEKWLDLAQIVDAMQS